nr:hypothetical protein CFP56_20938 [Quercus suber]
MPGIKSCFDRNISALRGSNIREREESYRKALDFCVQPPFTKSRIANPDTDAASNSKMGSKKGTEPFFIGIDVQNIQPLSPRAERVGFGGGVHEAWLTGASVPLSRWRGATAIKRLR